MLHQLLSLRLHTGGLQVVRLMLSESLLKLLMQPAIHGLMVLLLVQVVLQGLLLSVELLVVSQWVLLNLTMVVKQKN